MLPQETPGEACYWGLNEELMRKIAVAVVEAMGLPAHTWNTLDSGNRRTTCLMVDGSVTNRARVNALSVRLGDFYGLEFLENIGLSPRTTEEWPGVLLYGTGNRILLQLRLILLRLLLEH